MTDYGYKVLLCKAILIGWIAIVCLGHEISQRPVEIQPPTLYASNTLWFFHQVGVSPHSISVQINDKLQLWDIKDDTFDIGGIGGDYAGDNGFSIGMWVGIPVTELHNGFHLHDDELYIDSVIIQKEE